MNSEFIGVEEELLYPVSVKVLLHLLAFSACSWTSNVSAENATLTSDPVAAQYQGASDLVEGETFWRIRRDFNFDGIEDVAVSRPDMCGNVGCEMPLYLGVKEHVPKKFQYVGEAPLQWYWAYSLRMLREGYGEVTSCHKGEFIGPGEVRTYTDHVSVSFDGIKPLEGNGVAGCVGYHPEQRTEDAPCEACRYSSQIEIKNCEWKSCRRD